jgi:hypothetical protein
LNLLPLQSYMEHKYCVEPTQPFKHFVLSGFKMQ